LKRGAPGDAIADCTEALRLSAYENRVYVFRATAYWNKGDIDRAIADFTEAIRRKPPDVDRLYCLRGQAYQQKGDFTAAVADDNKAIQISPNYSGAAGCRNALRARRAGHHATSAVQDTPAFGSPAAPNRSWPGNSPVPYSADPTTQGKDPRAEDDFSDVKKFGAGLK
jgi:tetratricopeptide (TPR) repeat protein